MASALSRFARSSFAPPRYLSIPTVGIDLSASGAKGALVRERPHGLELASFVDIRFPAPALDEGDIIDRSAILKGLTELAKVIGVHVANVTLPESKSFLFEARAMGATKEEWRVSVEQHLEEYVPLPPAEVVFDITPIKREGEVLVLAGIAYARRVTEEILGVCKEAGLIVRALEGEMPAAARALLPFGELSTVLIIDIGKTTTKCTVVAGGAPRFATTIGIGGHSLTLSIQKYFGVTETEARKIKLEQGITSGTENAEYLAAMLSTASAIRDEVATKLAYWQEHVAPSAGHDPVSRAILVGGNASVRGLAEYFESTFQVPVTTGNVFANFASTDVWLPPLDYTQSLNYGTAIGLALREYAP